MSVLSTPLLIFIKKWKIENFSSVEKIPLHPTRSTYTGWLIMRSMDYQDIRSHAPAERCFLEVFEA